MVKTLKSFFPNLEVRTGPSLAFTFFGGRAELVLDNGYFTLKAFNEMLDGLEKFLNSVNGKYKVGSISMDARELSGTLKGEGLKCSFSYTPILFPGFWVELEAGGTVEDVVKELSSLWRLMAEIDEMAETVFRPIIGVVEGIGNVLKGTVNVHVDVLSQKEFSVSVKSGNLTVTILDDFIKRGEHRPASELMEMVEKARKVPDGVLVDIFEDKVSFEATFEDEGLKYFISDVLFSVTLRRGAPVEKVLKRLLEALRLTEMFGNRSRELEKVIVTIEENKELLEKGELWFAPGFKWDTLTFKDVGWSSFYSHGDGVEVSIPVDGETSPEFFELFGGLEELLQYASVDVSGYVAVGDSFRALVEPNEGRKVKVEVVSASTGSKDEFDRFVGALKGKGYDVEVVGEAMLEAPVLVLKAPDGVERLTALRYTRASRLEAEYVSRCGMKVSVVHPDAGVSEIELGLANELRYLAPFGSGLVEFNFLRKTVSFYDEKGQLLEKHPIILSSFKTA